MIFLLEVALKNEQNRSIAHPTKEIAWLLKVLIPNWPTLV